MELCWPPRRSTVEVSATACTACLMPEAGTSATPVTLDGTAGCATGS